MFFSTERINQLLIKQLFYASPSLAYQFLLITLRLAYRRQYLISPITFLLMPFALKIRVFIRSKLIRVFFHNISSSLFNDFVVPVSSKRVLFLVPGLVSKQTQQREKNEAALNARNARSHLWKPSKAPRHENVSQHGRWLPVLWRRLRLWTSRLP